MTVLELYNKLCERIPTSLSMEWDTDGFEICPDKDREVKRVLIALDVTDEVIDRAIDGGFDAIVAHHPVMFAGLNEVSELEPAGARAIKLIKNNISVMTFHTRLDAVDGGVNDVLAALLGLQNVEAVEFGGARMVRVGELVSELCAEDFARLVKEKLACPTVALAKASGMVRRVALIGGSGGDDMGVCAVCSADTFLTGELKHHQMLMARDIGANIVTAGHFYTENPVCSALKDFICELSADIECEIYFSYKVKEF